MLRADEPTSDLGERTAAELTGLFGRIHSQTGVTIVAVAYSTELVRCGTQSLRMAEGLIAEMEGSPGSTTVLCDHA